MKIMNRSLSLMYLLLIFSVAKIHGQVTVGSDIEPRKGTILDIKDKNTSDHLPNADGGLGLPRVKLVAPETLTIGNDESQKSKHAGVTVYNTGNTNIPEGIYTWDGSRWQLNVSVDSYGTDGQLLKSNGSGTFGWSTFVAPEFQYYKPTQISVLKSGNIEPKSYSYKSLTDGSSGNWGGQKPSAVFEYLYSDDLNLLSETANERYLLIGIAATTRTTTRKNNVPVASYWQIVGIDIDLTNKDGSNVRSLQKNQRLYKTAQGSDLRSYVDFFTIVPITGVGKGTYTLKIKVYNVENTFSRNLGVYDPVNGWPGGSFNPDENSFYDIYLVDINFILYEED